jgi:hypothetical protein
MSSIAAVPQAVPQAPLNQWLLAQAGNWIQYSTARSSASTISTPQVNHPKCCQITKLPNQAPNQTKTQ